MAGLSRPPVVGMDSREAEAFITRAGETPGDSVCQPATTALIQIDRARQALEMASSLDDVKELRDQAEALRLYAKQAQHSLEIQNRCAELKLRAERKAGLMLHDQDKNKGAAAADEFERRLPRLEDLGITHSQSSRWQAIASIPECVFEKRIDKTKDAGQELTSAAFLRLAGKFKPVEERPTSGGGGDRDPSAFGFLQARGGECPQAEATPVGSELARPNGKDAPPVDLNCQSPASDRPPRPGAISMVQEDFSFAEIRDGNSSEIRLTAEKLAQQLLQAREDGWKVISRDNVLALIKGLEAIIG